MLQNPDQISKAVLERELDSETSFEIADVDVGDNIGGRLRVDQTLLRVKEFHLSCGREETLP